MPTRGSNDAYAFRVGWKDASSLQSDYYNQFQKVSVWTQRTFDLTVPTSRANLSRRGGQVNVQFVDSYYPGTNGRGPTVDDIAITGYKYGPVRNVTATSPVPDTAVLSWTPPATSTGSSVNDTRVIGYRIWRTIAGNDSWQEVTPVSGRVSGTTFSDTGVVHGASYQYAVQAWDPGEGPGHGRQAVTSEYAAVLVTGAALPQASTLTRPSGPSSAFSWLAFTSSGALGPAHATAATVQVQRSSREGGPVVETYRALAAPSSTSYRASLKLPSGVWYLRARHADESHAETFSSWTRVVVYTHPVISAPKSPATMYRNRARTVYGTLRPRHGAKYLVVHAYKWNGTKYVYKTHFHPKVTNTNQSAGTTKYLASVKLPSKGTWRLRVKHSAHGSESGFYSSYSPKIKVK